MKLFRKDKDTEVERIKKLLKENASHVTIKSDGYLRLNLSNTEVRNSISETAKLFSHIKV